MSDNIEVNITANIPVRGYIYLLKLCDTNHRIIYKPGKCINFYKRYKKYNYAEILTFIVSDNITNDENEILNIFNINCKLDTGREFFLAKDDNFVLKLFMDYFSNKINRTIEISNSNSNNVVVTDNVVIEPVIIEPLVVEPLVVEPLVTDNVVIENVINTIIEYICPNKNCNKKFNYCSYLKKHLVYSYHCNKTIENIDSYISEIKEIKEIKKTNIVKIIKEYKCDNCKNNYRNNFTLQRHINKSNCTLFIQRTILLQQLSALQQEHDNLHIN